MPVSMFAGKIGSHGRVAIEWPFTPKHDTKRFSDCQTFIGDAVQGLRNGQVVGVVAGGEGERVDFRYVQHSWGGQPQLLCHGLLQFLMPDVHTARAWQQMAGVGLAVKAQYLRQSTMEQPQFYPRGIIAIEQPLTATRKPSWQFADERIGYIQGAVIDCESTDTAKKIRLSTPYGTATLLSPANIMPATGAIIRASVTEHPNVSTFINEGAVYHLGAIAFER